MTNTAIAGVPALFDVTLEAKGKAFSSYSFAQVTVIAAIIGVVLAAAPLRKARTPRHTFVVATLLLVVPPLLIGATAVNVLVLELKHIVAALIVIPAIATRLAD